MSDGGKRKFRRDWVCFGHRGARGLAPENTLPSIECGLALGANGIEIDVHRVENRLLVIHDETFDRTTNGGGDVRGSTFEAARKLDAGGGARIPTLEEVVDCVRNRAILNVELKSPGSAELTSRILWDRVSRGAAV